MKNLFWLLCIPALVNANVWPAYHNTVDREGIALRYGPNCCDTVCSADIEWSRASPAIDGSRNVYMQGGVSGSGPWCLFKVNADNCAIKWTLQISSANPASAPQATCAISGDTVIYFGTISDSSLWAVRSDGTVKWKYKLNDKIRASPIVTEDGSVIYIISDKGRLYAINSDSTLKWSYPISGVVTIETSSPAIGQSAVYVGCQNSNLYAINSSDGTLKWSYTTPADEINSTPAVWGDTIYFGCRDHKVYAVTDAGTAGNTKWSYGTGDDVNSSPALDTARGMLYVGSNNSKLFALNIFTGALKWSRTLNGDPGLSSPAVAYSNNMIYIGDLANYIYIIENMTDSGRIVCSKVHNYEITSPAIDIDTSIWYNEYSKALHKLKCWIPPGGVEECNYKQGVKLGDNSPNPFARETQISFTIPEKSYVKLGIYDLSGRVVKELIKGNYSAGTYTVKWDAKDNNGNKVNAGIYLYKLKANSTEIIRKMTVISQ